MNGIYIHIPFCKKVCYYCDFHFTVSLKQKDAVINAILKEIDLRKNYLFQKITSVDDNYLPSKEINTIYFGGGTPSVFTPDELNRILEKIHRSFTISRNAEITLEANPDDLNPMYLKSLHALGINRLSIGIQSFFDEDLQWMNRRHNGQDAERAVKISQDTGFDNLNLDLIYGLPQLTEERWIQNLEKFFSLEAPHLSAYHLTIEPKTVFGYYKSKGRLTEIDEEQSVLHYRILVDAMKHNGYIHYEISNFCKEGKYSRHNTNYWNYGHYLGLGPAAHSYNGLSRQWNNKITDYLKSIGEGQPFYEVEQLSDNEKFNDYLLTGLRTMWGIDRGKIQNTFGYAYEEHLDKELARFKETGLIEEDQGKIKLTEEGMFVSDKIISELFRVE